MADVILVLARGIEKDGSVPEDAKSRVRKGVELYKAQVACKLVMSGSWTYHFDIAPPRTEAEAMKEYAVQLGIPTEDIVEETLSQDTLGNAYFTKKTVCEPNDWKDIIVVASDDHMPRVKYLFEKLYGPDYTLDFIESERVLSDEAHKKESEHEQRSIKITKEWLDSLNPGDDKTVWELMSSKHPAYSNSNHNSKPLGEDLYPNLP